MALGLDRTGGIVSAAACCLALAMGALVLSRLVFVKELGLGVAFAVLLDATLVRAVLVPAVMKLLGPAAWWNPFSRRPALAPRSHPLALPQSPVGAGAGPQVRLEEVRSMTTFHPFFNPPPASGSSTPPWPRTATVNSSASTGAACPVG